MDKFIPKTVPFWAALTEEQKQLCISSAETRAFSKGMVVYHMGMQEASFKIVRSGLVRVFISTSDGNEVTLYRLAEGDMCVLSVVCIMNMNTLDIHIEAEKDSVICMIPGWVYQRINEENSQVKDFTQKILTERIHTVMQVISDLAFSNIGKRIANSLLRKMELENTRELALTHEALAKDIGSAREVISRTLKHFQSLGIVKLSRGRIEILDVEELKKQ